MLEFGKDAMELHDIITIWAAIHNPPWLVEERIGKLANGWDPDHVELAKGWKGRKRIFDIERFVFRTRMASTLLHACL